MLLHRRCRICSRPVCLNLFKHLSCLDRFFLTRVQYVAMGLYMFIYYYLFIYLITPCISVHCCSICLSFSPRRFCSHGRSGTLFRRVIR